MTIRQEVINFVKLGPLPASSAPVEKIAEHETHLAKIQRPVTDEEARLLLVCFGPDDCFGGAWTLLHLIESAPGGCPLKEPPAPDENEWIKRIWERAHRV